jgi:hypothetical protein
MSCMTRAFAPRSSIALRVRGRAKRRSAIRCIFSPTSGTQRSERQVAKTLTKGHALFARLVELYKLRDIVCRDRERERLRRRHQQMDQDPDLRFGRQRHALQGGEKNAKQEETERKEMTHLSCSRSLSVSLLALSRQKSSFLCVGDHVRCPLASSDLYSSKVLLVRFVFPKRRGFRKKSTRKDQSDSRRRKDRDCEEAKTGARLLTSCHQSST